MNPPTMAGWNLALRFGLELAALAGLGFAAWRFTDGASRWIAVVAVPLVVAAVWGTFNVPGDPSRSGAAPIEVGGFVRLGLELAILAGGAVALYAAGRRELGLVLGAAVLFHYLASSARIDWLLHR